jgi:hypothetical protein
LPRASDAISFYDPSVDAEDRELLSTALVHLAAWSDKRPGQDEAARERLDEAVVATLPVPASARIIDVS